MLGKKITINQENQLIQIYFQKMGERRDFLTKSETNKHR